MSNPSFSITVTDANGRTYTSAPFDLTAVPPSGGGSSGGATTLQMVTHSAIAGSNSTSMGGSLYGGEVGVATYDQYPLLGGCDMLQAAFSTACRRDGDYGEHDQGPCTFDLAYEFPAGSGTLYKALWGGAASIAAPANTHITALHDPLHIPGLASAAAGTKIGIVTKINGQSYLLYYAARHPTSVGKKTIWASGTGPDVMTTDRSAWTETGDFPMPVLVCGQMAVTASAEVYVGDSITNDFTNTLDAQGVCGFAQEVDAAHATLKLAATGNSLSAFASGGFAAEAAIIAAIPNARVNVHVNLGVNDLGDAARAQALSANLADLIGQIHTARAQAAGVYAYPMTISPRYDGGSQGAGGALTRESDRATYNAAIEAGIAGAASVYRYGAWAEAANAEGSGLWGAVSGVPKTQDGQHPDWTQSGVVADLFASRRAWRTSVGI